MAVAANADDYAAARVGIFFPGVTPYYDGQCVSLEKWFLGEMAGVADWNAARGNANTCGRTLVAQGLAVEVPYNQRRRGDVVCLEYGAYGHVYIQLSGGRVFEENVNMPGTTRKWVVDDYVYSARIGSDQEAWRIAAGKNPHVYRLKGYSEAGGSDMPIPNADNYYGRYRKAMQYIRGRDMSREEFNANFVGRSDLTMLEAMLDSPEADAQVDYANWGRTAKNDNWQGQIYGLQDQLKVAQAALAQAQADLAAAVAKVDDLDDRPTVEQLSALNERLKTAQQNATDAQSALDKANAQTTADTATGNAFVRWIGNMFNKLNGGK